MGKLLDEAKQEMREQAPRGYARSGLKLDSYWDNTQDFWTTNPFFYDKNQMFWLWNKKEYRYEIVDETEIMNLIDRELGFAGQTINKGIKANYIEAFRRVGRTHLPEAPPKTWIQFKNKIIDIKTGTKYEATPNYFICNPIPWTLGCDEETPTIDKLFTDWQGINKEILYEVLAYCLLPDYPIHIIIANVGTGRNGKSQYTKIIERFIGKENTTSTELDSLIKERFESAKLHKKLVCLMGETNFGVMSQTSLLKKLCGGDLISYEYKNKMPFTDCNYAKIIINTNNLPTTGDTTDGFFRRWLILNWDNNFAETGKDIYETIPNQEYNNLALKCVNKLITLLDIGRFSLQGEIEDRKQKYIMASNPIGMFLTERCLFSDSSYVKAKDLYHAYIIYLQEKKRRIIKRKEFNQILAEEGYQAEHCQKKSFDENGDLFYENSYWIDGLKLKTESPNSPNSPVLSTSPSYTTGQKFETRANGENLSLDSPFLKSETDFSYEILLCMILERVPQEIKVEEIISYGGSEKQIAEWKEKGLIFEQPCGVIKLV